MTKNTAVRRLESVAGTSTTSFRSSRYSSAIAVETGKLSDQRTNVRSEERLPFERQR